MSVIVYNCYNEDHSAQPNNYPIYRGTVLGNPFTFNGKRSNKAKLTFRTRNEALNAYRIYFDNMYGTDKAFTEYFDKIYEKYKNGETIYLQCFCKPEPCHGDIILEKLQQKYAKELIKNKLKMSK